MFVSAASRFSPSTLTPPVISLELYPPPVISLELYHLQLSPPALTSMSPVQVMPWGIESLSLISTNSHTKQVQVEFFFILKTHVFCLPDIAGLSFQELTVLM